jgi:HEPN domain-containing protein
MTLARTDLQALAEVRAKDALLLLQEQRYSSAYYLAGYAVEFALKACAAKQVTQHTIPDKNFISDLHTHDLNKLISLSGLRSEFTKKLRDSSDFKVNWAIAAEWSPEARYRVLTAADSQDMVKSVISDNDGVLGWIKIYW